MPLTRRKFLSGITAAVAVAKAGVCALPKMPERYPDYFWTEYRAEFYPPSDAGMITIEKLQAAYAQCTFEPNQYLYWSKISSLDVWPEMHEAELSQSIFEDGKC